MRKQKLMIITLMYLFLSVFIGCSSDGAEEKKSYPQKPIRVIVPFAPGGGSDILVRAIMKYIDLPNEQNLVAINVEGAAGYVGAQHAKNSKNDGYTILAHNPMDVVSYTLNGTTQDTLWEDLVMICTVVDDYSVLSTSPKTGWTSTDDIVNYVKNQYVENESVKIKLGTVGSKGVNYADALRVVRALDIEDAVTIIPYDSGTACKTALMGKHIQLEVNSGSDIRSSVESGDAIPLMVIGNRNSLSLPGVPTSKDLGLDILTAKPRGYYAPAGTDPENIAIIAAAIKEVAENPEFIKMVEGLGLDVNFVEGVEAQNQVEKLVEELKPIFKEMSNL